MIRALLPCLAALLIAGCGGDRTVAAGQDLDDLDRDLAAGNDRDPALTSALAGQIMVDPALVQSANAHAIRPPDRPADAPIPPDAPLADPLPDAAAPAAAARRDCPDCAARRGTLTIGALAERQRDRGTAGCAAGIGYSAGWATSLPAALPLYPGAVLREAAGNDAAGCRLRIVAFAAGASPAKTAGFYAARARAAGFTAEVQADGRARVVGGTRGRDAFVVYADPRADGGAEVQLVVNGG